jgi:predicted alpha/beta-fold hydrolase
MRVIDRVALPALIITAEDDPFVPPEPFRDPRVTGNPHITTVITRHGGHCGFI